MQKKKHFCTFCKSIKSVLFTGISYSNINKIVGLNKIFLIANIVPYAYDKAKIQEISNELFDITNQNPIMTKAKKSIASLSLRAGVPASLIVTLHGQRMYSFLEKCLYFAFPKIRDFNGFPLTSFDKKGNYTIFIKDRFIFSEVKYNEFDLNRGYTIVFAINSNSKYKSFLYLKKIGLPFIKSSIINN